MCRMAGYLGPALLPAELIFGAPHGLEQQACAPREMISGTVNVDGTGVAWWRDEEPEPLRYVTSGPPWADVNLPHLTRRLPGRAILAAVRSATPGIPGGPASVAPFVDGELAVAHNGYVNGFDGPVGRRLIDQLPDDLHARLETRSDSLALFLLLTARRRERPGEGLDELLARVCSEVYQLAQEESVAASLTLMACDGRQLAATRCAVGVASNTLYVAPKPAQLWPGDGVLMASEPLDETGSWQPVEDGHRVLAGPSGLRMAPI
jgi:glutamine amidotransferase